MRLPEPMLATPVADSRLPAGFAAEPKWDGFRVIAGQVGGSAEVRSKNGNSLAAAFPEIAAAVATDLPSETMIDGELIIWESVKQPDGSAVGQLSFRLLQARLSARRTAAERALRHPAHLVVFDILQLAGDDLVRQPYQHRRTVLESLFTERGLAAKGVWTLCPSTTDPAEAAGWLTWTTVGLEGLVFKRLDQGYISGKRGWLKHRVRDSAEAVIGAVSGSLTRPRTLLLGRFDSAGQLHYVGRSSVLSQAAARDVAGRLLVAAGRHPWTGWTFSSSWGSTSKLAVDLVAPTVVVELAADAAVDASGRWRHPLPFVRIRPDLTPDNVTRVPRSPG